ncbi:hypothetical protein [Sphaerisporangium fuscum]|nr:hypothetical protein [Sphaerisporangium fuscum]
MFSPAPALVTGLLATTLVVVVTLADRAGRVGHRGAYPAARTK